MDFPVKPNLRSCNETCGRKKYSGAGASATRCSAVGHPAAQRFGGSLMTSFEASPASSQELTSVTDHVSGRQSHPKIAVVVPCYNEEAAIGEVITQFRQELPHADVH